MERLIITHQRRLRLLVEPGHAHEVVELVPSLVEAGAEQRVHQSTHHRTQHAD